MFVSSIGYTNIKFLTEPVSQYIVSGDIALLPCQAQGVNSQGETEFLSVIFYKNNKVIPIYPAADYEYLFDTTSRITKGLTSPETSITDNGATFQCKLLINDTITTPPIRLTVAGECVHLLIAPLCMYVCILSFSLSLPIQMVVLAPLH